jgi:hypothetical protein
MIQIDELHLRLANVGEEEGRAMSQKIAEGLAESMPTQNSNAYIPEVKIRLDPAVASRQTNTGDSIVAEVIRQIKMYI